MSSKPFNGHPNWNQWNVSLWIHNDEGLYHMARGLKRLHGNSRDAARAMQSQLAADGITATPDGGRYSVAALSHAIAGLDS